MGLAALKFQYELNAIECANCGIMFGIPADFEERRRKDHKGFHCPHGHSNIFNAETAEEKLQKRLEVEKLQTQMEREQRLKLERQLARVAKGVCPKCNRCFKNVERHMKSKHTQRRIQ